MYINYKFIIKLKVKESLTNIEGLTYTPLFLDIVLTSTQDLDICIII